ncbi:DUF4359 domain-containing protein [Sporosarcina luteola]|uniref:DUF4359 domain-containing protein n=1 Tax=Bacillales TaxID=1385 RepID=UPI00203F98B5|nr:MULTISPECIES: DUF4359 domain-containing protein [Bacillales]MCM3636284.1 DUF4359 domain-containing protein [Sporosarcina luteola]
MKKRYLIGGLLLFILLFALVTNPSEKEYLQFSEEHYGPPPLLAKIETERINFLLFSTYTPIYHFEYGITYLGAFGMFFQISDGQFDYPRWLELFK